MKATQKISSFDQADLIEQVAICKKWCGERLSSHAEFVDFSKSLRSPELSAAADDAFPQSCHTEYSESFLSKFRDFQRLRKDLAGTILETNIESIGDQSLVAFNWRFSLFDGAASPESLGYFNDDYMPPWDVWLTTITTAGNSSEECFLIAWVPPAFATYVERGILVDPAESLSWCRVTSDGKLELMGWGQPWPPKTSKS